MNVRRYLLIAFIHAILNCLVYWFVASTYIENALLLWALVVISLVVDAIVVYRWKSLQSVKERIVAFFGYFFIAVGLPFMVLIVLSLNIFVGALQN
jgi:hypothetical protein